MLARALVHEPKLLILDEPTAGLDIELRRSLWDYLRIRNQQGLTIILTTHYLEEAEALCKRVAIIDQGVILTDSPTRDLLGQLKRQTFVLELAESRPLCPNQEQLEFRSLDELTWEVDVANELDMNSLFQYLNEQKVRVQSLRTKSNRLEELFVNLVGRKGKGLS